MLEKKLAEVSVDSEKDISNINEKLENILSWTKKCKSGIEALVEGHNKGIDGTGKAFLTINDTLNNINDNINNVIIGNKVNNVDIAKISSMLDSCKEKINYITTCIENVTKLKTASKTKSTQTKTTTTKIGKKRYTKIFVIKLLIKLGS